MSLTMNTSTSHPKRRSFAGRIANTVESMPITALGGAVVIILYMIVAVIAPAIAP